MSASVVVLWEDSVAQPHAGESGARFGLGVTPKGFGPNVLLLACIADRTFDEAPDAGAWWKGRKRADGRIASYALNGNGNVKKRCEEWVERGHSPFVAVLDLDRLPRLVGLPGHSDAQACADAFARMCGDAEQKTLRVAILDANMETLVTEAAKVSGLPTPDNPKEHLARDRVLSRIAHDSAHEARDSLRARLPSFGRIVEIVGTLYDALPE